MIMGLKQEKIKFKPRRKLNHNMYMQSPLLATCTPWYEDSKAQILPQRVNLPVKEG